MRLPIALLLVAALAVAGCGRIRDSRINPFNWFGRSAPAATVTTPAADQPADPRALVAEVVAMEVTAQPGGAIVHATGLPPTQGWWQADLVAANGGVPVDGVLSYRFVVEPPPASTARVSTPQSREVTAAVFVTERDLEGVRSITVIGASGSRTARR